MLSPLPVFYLPASVRTFWASSPQTYCPGLFRRHLPPLQALRPKHGMQPHNTSIPAFLHLHLPEYHRYEPQPGNLPSYTLPLPGISERPAQMRLQFHLLQKALCRKKRWPPHTAPDSSAQFRTFWPPWLLLNPRIQSAKEPPIRQPARRQTVCVFSFSPPLCLYGFCLSISKPVPATFSAVSSL